MKRFWKRILGERGLSLLELTVVMAVIAVLATLTAVAVTGATGTAKATAKNNDEQEVTKAASNFSGTHSKAYRPVTLTKTLALGGVPKVFKVDEQTLDGGLGIDIDGDGSMGAAVEVYEINFSADDTTGKTLVPSYLPKTSKHAGETIAAKDSAGLPATIGVWLILKATDEATVAVSDSNY